MISFDIIVLLNRLAEELSALRMMPDTKAVMIKARATMMRPMQE